MDYKDRIGRAETLGRKLLEYGEKMCSPDLCTCANVMLEDATAITELLARAEAAEARAEKAEKERDAAVEQLRGLCSACKHYTPYHNDGPCATCTHEVACFAPEKATDKWEWVGVKEE